MENDKYKENGNVIFIILIAVALFAALAYAVTSSTRSGSGTSKETNTLIASTIINKAIALRTATQRMLTSGDCQIYQINFAYSGDTSSFAWMYWNPYSPTDKRCHIFDFSSSGGKVSPSERVSTDWLDPTKSTNIFYGYWVAPRPRAVSTLGTSSYELIYILPYIKKEICDSINSKLGIKSLVYFPAALDDRLFPDGHQYTPYTTVTPTYDGFGGTDYVYEDMYCARSHNAFESSANIQYDFIAVLKIQ